MVQGLLLSLGLRFLFLSVSLLSMIQACVCVRAHRYCLLFAIGLGRKGGKGCVSEAWCLGFGLI